MRIKDLTNCCFETCIVTIPSRSSNIPLFYIGCLAEAEDWIQALTIDDLTIGAINTEDSNDLVLKITANLEIEEDM